MAPDADHVPLILQGGTRLQREPRRAAAPTSAPPSRTGPSGGQAAAGTGTIAAEPLGRQADSIIGSACLPICSANLPKTLSCSSSRNHGSWRRCSTDALCAVPMKEISAGCEGFVWMRGPRTFQTSTLQITSSGPGTRLRQLHRELHVRNISTYKQQVSTCAIAAQWSHKRGSVSYGPVSEFRSGRQRPASPGAGSRRLQRIDPRRQLGLPKQPAEQTASDQHPAPPSKKSVPMGTGSEALCHAAHQSVCIAHRRV